MPGKVDSEALWSSILATPLPIGGEKLREAVKALRELPSDVSPALAERIYRYFRKESPLWLWRSLGRIHEEHAAALMKVLHADKSVPAFALAVAHEIAGVEGVREASTFFEFVGKSTNLPGALKRLPELSPSEALALVAARVVDATKGGEQVNEATVPFWCMVWIAAQRDGDVLSRMEPKAKAWGAAPVLERVRGATTAPTKKPKAKQPARGAPEVTGLADHAFRPKATARERAAAVRALASAGTNEALDLLATHQSREFPDAVAKEIAAAWPRFDRAAFAHRVFGPEQLFFANARPLGDLSGMEAAKDLSWVTLRVTPTCNLSPLVKLPNLRFLSIDDFIDQAALETLAGAPKLERLLLACAAGVDLRVLTRFRTLRRLKFIPAPTPKVDEATVAAFGDLVERGVEVMFYESPWAIALADSVGAHVARAHGFVALTSDPSRVEPLRRAEQSNTFPFYEHPGPQTAALFARGTTS
jgi:hypothetical protein